MATENALGVFTTRAHPPTHPTESEKKQKAKTLPF